MLRHWTIKRYLIAGMTRLQMCEKEPSGWDGAKKEEKRLFAYARVCVCVCVCVCVTERGRRGQWGMSEGKGPALHTDVKD